MQFQDILEPYSLPLTRDPFARALRQGMGRVRLHVQDYGLGDYLDLVMAACLENVVYDWQCEAGRSRWLLDLLDRESEELLLDRLFEVMPRADLCRHQYQHCDLCLELFHRGHLRAREALYAGFRFTENGEAPRVCSGRRLVP